MFRNHFDFLYLGGPWVLFHPQKVANFPEYLLAKSIAVPVVLHVTVLCQSSLTFGFTASSFFLYHLAGRVISLPANSCLLAAIPSSNIGFVDVNYGRAVHILRSIFFPFRRSPSQSFLFLLHPVGRAAKSFIDFHRRFKSRFRFQPFFTGFCPRLSP